MCCKINFGKKYLSHVNVHLMTIEWQTVLFASLLKNNINTYKIHSSNVYIDEYKLLFILMNES